MVIKIGFTRKLFKSLMYKDRMEVYRLGLTMGEDFTVSNEQSVQHIYTKIPCKISLNYQDLPEEDSLLINPTNQHIGIFCDPSYDIRKGDKIKAYVLDDHGNVLDTYTDYAGRPEKHTSHQQFALVNREFA